MSFIDEFHLNNAIYIVQTEKVVTTVKYRIKSRIRKHKL